MAALTEQVGALTQQFGYMSELVYKHDVILHEHSVALAEIKRDLQMLIDVQLPKNGGQLRRPSSSLQQPGR